MDWSRVPLLLVTSALLIGGLVDPLSSTTNSEAMVSVGFFMLGLWASIEIQSWYQKLKASWLTGKPIPEPQPDTHRAVQANADDGKSGL